MRVPARGPFDAVIAARVLAAHDVPGVSATDVTARRHRRWIRVGGRQVPVTLALIEDVGVDIVIDAAFVPAGWQVPGRAARPDAGPVLNDGMRRSLRGLVTRWFGLDVDLEPAHRALAGDPVLAPLIEARPGLRVTGCVDEFEAVVTVVLGQQVSLAACRTFAGRFVAAARLDVMPGAAGHARRRHGGPDGAGRTMAGAGLVPFPGPERYAGLEATELQQAVGITGARARTLAGVVAAWSEGFRLAVLSPEEGRAALLALPGIGPWTADYLAVRLLGDADVFVSGDLVARRAMARALGAGPLTPRQAAREAERWSPWRSYALFHLWAAEAYADRDPAGGPD
ncbi:AlkA N-terminal domain-containing protein [Zhihengliuella sp.]|uniref:DNA-3-methyladenine glycosylase 2 n=1 Tax=Zhihengliuella sp. TaxID=1954483 RepID=UPI0028124D11|nr:AlkA N-terminal domain-containing protein [Zhihengliuella sp.]